MGRVFSLHETRLVVPGTTPPSLLVCLLTLLTMLFTLPAQADTPGITYQGRIVDSSGQPLQATSVEFFIGISPSPSCLLYAERFTLDMSSGNGHFALILGQGQRTDASDVKLHQLFNPTRAYPKITQCPDGFPKKSTDKIYLSVAFNAGGGPQTLEPIEITPAPFAVDSLNVAGVASANVVRVKDGPAKELTKDDFSELQALLAGTSSQYAKANEGRAHLTEADVPRLSMADKVSGSAIVSGTIGGTTSISTSGSIRTSTDMMAQSLSGSTTAAGTLTLDSTTNATKGVILLNPTGGQVGVGTTTPTARLHLGAGTGSAHTAPLKITPGTILNTPEPGAIEFDGTSLFYTTNDGVRQTIGAAGSGITAIYGDVTASGNGSASSIVNSVGGATAANINTAVVEVNTKATSASTVSVLVKRDGTGGASFKGIKLDGSTSGTLTQTVPATTTSYTVTWPSSAPGVANSVLTSDTSGNLAWINLGSIAGTINLSTQTTGTLPINKGGTNSTASLVNNRVIVSSAGAMVEATAITPSRALVSDTNGLPAHSTVTGTELGYVSGVTSPIQTQLNDKPSGTGWTNFSVIGASGSGNMTAIPGTINGSILAYTPSGPAWTTTAYPSETTVNQLLYSSANNVVGQIPTANNAILTTNSSGVPAWSVLSNDTFAQYALLAGRAGGQTLYGGNAASNDLKLDSTSHATKGNILLAPNGGNVGIGTKPPRANLSIHANPASYTQPLFTVQQSGDFTPMNDYVATVQTYGNRSSLGNGTQHGLYVQAGWSGDINQTEIARFSALYTGFVDVPRMVILSTGNVGIGTTTPSADAAWPSPALDISGSRGTAILRTTTTNGLSTLRMAGPTSGNDFHVNFSDQTGSLTFGPQSGSIAAMSISKAGNIGIGSVTPSLRLDAWGTSATNSAIRINSNTATDDSTEAAIIVRTPSMASGDPSIKWDYGSSGLWGMGVDNSDLAKLKIFQNSSTYRPGAGDLMTFTTGGNVGIGTTNPQAKLEVNGSLKTGGMFSNGVVKYYTVSAGGQGNVNSTYELMRIGRDSANWGGTTYEVTVYNTYYRGSVTKWIINYNQIDPGSVFCTESYGASPLKLYLGTEVTVSGTITYRPVLVDIPNYQSAVIEVKHTATEVSAITHYSQVQYTGTITAGTGTNYNGNINLAATGGSVGIGGMTPSQQLTVNNGIRANSIYIGANSNFSDRGGDGDNLYIRHPVRTSGGWWGVTVSLMGTLASHTTDFYPYRYLSDENSDGAEETYRFHVDKTGGAFFSGNVGIGTSSPAYKLDVNGDINIASARALRFNGTSVCTSAGCTSSSDQRLKENITPLKHSLEKILELRGVQYSYKDKAMFGDSPQIGVIAQDVEKVFPEVVRTDSESGLKSVAYDHLVAPIIEAVKVLHDRITAGEIDRMNKERELASIKDKKADKSEIEDLRTENAILRSESLLLRARADRADARAEKAEKNYVELKTRLDKIEKMLRSK